MYKQRQKHRPLFEDEVTEMRADPRKNAPNGARRAPAVRRKRKKGVAGFLRNAGIAAKIVAEEAASFLKRTFAGKPAHTVAAAAIACAVGLTAIISVAAVAASMKDDAADAGLAPQAGQTAGAEENDSTTSDDAETQADTDKDIPADTEFYQSILATNGWDIPEETEKTEATEGVSDTDAAADEETADVNKITVTFWDKESVVLESSASTVGEFLTESGIELTDAQYANIDTSLPIGGDITITADVVTYDKVAVEEVLEYDTEYRSDASLPEGTTKTVQYGINGSQTREFTVTYVNGVEVSREQTASWIDARPQTQIIASGTGSANGGSYDSSDTGNAPGSVSPDFSGSGGTFVGADGVERAYSYYIDVKATCYYVGGTTATGLPANEGVIAVDPSVIPLGSKVYVTGSYGDFGERIAADTGGSIYGYRIDICIDPSDPRAGSFGWRDMRVYFLA